MKENKNYKDFDYLSIYVKRELAQEIIQYYNTLGWKLAEQKDNGRYDDIVDLSFSRPHKIENKDELQLLQVYMEERFNTLGKLRRHRHSLSTALGLCFGVIGAALIALGHLFILNILPLLGLAGGISFCATGAILLILCAIIIPKIYKKEKRRFELKFQILQNQLENIARQASRLIGGKDE